MALDIGRKGWVGVGLQSGFQVPATIADYIDFTENELKGMVEQLDVDHATGNRERLLSTVAGKQWSEGDFEAYVNSRFAGYFVVAALGTVQSTNLAGSVYRHTVTRNNSNTPQYMTMISDRVVDRQLYADVAVKEFELTVGVDLAKFTASLVGNFPQTTTSGTKTTASGGYYSFAQAQFAFGTTISGAQAATPLKPHDLTLNINNNTEVIHAHGSPLPRSINHGEFEAGMEFTLYFENTTDRDAYYQQSKQAASFELIGNGIGGGYYDSTIFNFYQTAVKSFELETGLEDFFAEKVELTAEYDTATGRSVDATLINTKASY